MSKMSSPAYLMYPGDILSSGRVAALEPLEELWYRRAIDLGWEPGGMPADPAEFAGWVSRGCTVEAAQKIIQKFYVPHRKDASMVVQPRQEKERKKFLKKSFERSKAGIESGRKRRERRRLADEQLLNKTGTKSNIPIPILILNKDKDKEEEKVAETAPIPPDVKAVFDHWQKVCNKPAHSLTPLRRTTIAARLKDGFTVEQLQRAITIAAADPFYAGQNDRQTEYLDFKTIFKNQDKVENFLFTKPAEKPVDEEYQKQLAAIRQSKELSRYVRGN